MFDMSKMQNILSSLKDTQNKFKAIIVIGKAGDSIDYVAIHMNCNHQMVRLEIAPELLKKATTENGASLLKDLIMMAHHDAIKKVEQRLQQEMLGIAKELDPKISDQTEQG